MQRSKGLSAGMYAARSNMKRYVTQYYPLLLPTHVVCGHSGSRPGSPPGNPGWAKIQTPFGTSILRVPILGVSGITPFGGSREPRYPPYCPLITSYPRDARRGNNNPHDITMRIPGVALPALLHDVRDAGNHGIHEAPSGYGVMISSSTGPKPRNE